MPSPSRNGPILQAAKLVRSGRLLSSADQRLIVQAAGLLLGEYATSAPEKNAVQSFVNRDIVRPATRELLDTLEDRGQFNAGERRVLETAMRMVSFGSEPDPEPPPDVELEKKIIEAAAAKEMLGIASDRALDGVIVAEAERRRRIATATKAIPEEERQRLAEQIRTARSEYEDASQAVNRQASRLQDLLNKRSNRKRAWLLARMVKT